nr:EOG090X0CKF [Daphnia magna]
MAKVHVQNVVVLDNPSNFSNPFQFEITFECLEDLQEDLEWKIIYVGSAESETYDQVLDTVYVGPVPEGRHMFVFQAEPPQPSKIPVADAVGVTVVLLTCSYRGQEFIRVGYYVNNEYGDAELKENPPAVPQFDKLMRNILATNPRVTRFKVDWDDTNKSGTTKVTTFSILIKLYDDGMMSNIIRKKWLAGYAVDWRGPIGEYNYQPNSYRNVLLIAAGTGITPVYQIARMIIDNPEDETRVVLLYSCRTYADIIFRDKFHQLQDYWNFKDRQLLFRDRLQVANLDCISTVVDNVLQLGNLILCENSSMRICKLDCKWSASSEGSHIDIFSTGG